MIYLLNLIALLFLHIAIPLGIYMLVWWVIALIAKRNDVADIAWGPGIALVPLIAYFSAYTVEATLTQVLIIIAVTLWAVRLAWHIGVRFFKKGEEDGRYASMRASWKGPQWLNSLVRVFLLQGLLAALITLAPVTGAAYRGVEPTWLTFVGFGIWVIGFLFETIGDWQLAAFIKNKKNKGKIMKEGLWRYTRHPNYFGEVTLWWGVWLMVMSVELGLWWTIISPLTITFLILKVSGIPMTEARWKGNKDFEAYKKKTSAFFPLPPKR